MRAIYRAGLRLLTDKQLMARRAELWMTCREVEAEYEKRPLAQRVRPPFSCHERLDDVNHELKRRGLLPKGVS